MEDHDTVHVSPRPFQSTRPKTLGRESHLVKEGKEVLHNQEENLKLTLLTKKAKNFQIFSGQNGLRK